MNYSLLLAALLFSTILLSQEEKSSIYFPQEQLMLLDCMNQADNNTCLYQYIEKKFLPLLKSKKSNREVGKLKKDTLKVSVRLTVDNQGRIIKDQSAIRFGSKKLSQKLESDGKNIIKALPIFGIENRKPSPLVSAHFLNYNYLVIRKPNQINLQLLPNKKKYKGGTIEEIPVFPGCENRSQTEGRHCFQKKIQEHIKKNFNYPSEAISKKITGRVSIIMTINKEGLVTKIRTRGPSEILENEARRICSLLPKMQPGLQNGQPVKVPYSIPITFKL